MSGLLTSPGREALKKIDALEQRVRDLEEQLHRLADIVNVLHLRDQQQARKQKDGE